MFETLGGSENEDRIRTSEHAEEPEESTSFEGPPMLAFFLAIGLVLVSMVLAHYGSMRAFTAIAYLAVAVFIVGVFWRLTKRAWFRMVIAVLLLLHVPLVLFEPLSGFWLHGKNMMIIDLADILVYCLSIATVRKFTENVRKIEG